MMKKIKKNEWKGNTREKKNDENEIQSTEKYDDHQATKCVRGKNVIYLMQKRKGKYKK